MGDSLFWFRPVQTFKNCVFAYTLPCMKKQAVLNSVSSRHFRWGVLSWSCLNALKGAVVDPFHPVYLAKCGRINFVSIFILLPKTALDSQAKIKTKLWGFYLNLFPASKEIISTKIGFVLGFLESNHGIIWGQTTEYSNFLPLSRYRSEPRPDPTTKSPPLRTTLDFCHYHHDPVYSRPGT